MPRRAKPNKLAKKIGERVGQLREARGLTQEKLSYEFDIASKGYLSDLERGLVLPGLEMLQRIADALEVELLDLFVAPGDGARHDLVEATRSAAPAAIRKLLTDATPTRSRR